MAAAFACAAGEPETASPSQLLTGISLEQAEALAREHSIRLRIADARTESAEGARDARVAAYRPKVDLLVKSEDNISGRSPGYQRTLDEYGQSQLTMQYTLLDFGRRKADLAKASHEVASSRWAEEQELQDVTFKTVRAYVDVDRYRRILAAADAHVAELEHFSYLMGERVKAGISPESELIRTRLATTGALNQRKRVLQKLNQSQQSLQSLTGQSVTALPISDEIGSNRVAGTGRHMIAAALQGNPSVRARREQVLGSQEDVRRAQRDHLPKIDLVAGYKQPFDSELAGAMGGNVGVQMTVNVFDGGARRARSRQALAAQDEAQAQADLVEREVTDAAQRLLDDAATSWDQIRLSLDGRGEAKRTKELYTDEFTLGTRSVSDLITAQTDTFNQESELRDAVANHLLSAVGLYHLQGDVNAGLEAYGLIDARRAGEH